MLGQTKPYVRFVSVVYFFCAIVALVISVVHFVIAMLEPPSRSAGIASAVALAYIVVALLHFVPPALLWMYASRIGEFLQRRSPRLLASALEAQKFFWKLIGGVTLFAVFLSLGPIMFLVVGLLLRAFGY